MIGCDFAGETHNYGKYFDLVAIQNVDLLAIVSTVVLYFHSTVCINSIESKKQIPTSYLKIKISKIFIF